jgi:predicted HTH domain antitoxin
MVLNIPDNLLQQAGFADEREALVEFACRLFDAGRLPLWPAAQLAGLTRSQFEQELRHRGIAIYRPTIEEFEEDLRTIRKLER